MGRFALYVFGVMVLSVASNCTAENLGCVANAHCRRDRIEAYRFELPPEKLVPEVVALLAEKRFHVPSPTGPMKTTLVTSWRYEELNPRRSRYLVEVRPAGEGATVRVVGERQDLESIRWEVFATERQDGVARDLAAALAERAAQGEGPGDAASASGACLDRASAEQAIAFELLSLGRYLAPGGLRVADDGRWEFRTEPLSSGPDERSRWQGFVACDPARGTTVEVSTVRDRAVGVRAAAAPTSTPDEDLTLDLISRVDPEAGAEIVETCDGRGEAVAGQAFRLGVPTCSGDCIFRPGN